MSDITDTPPKLVVALTYDEGIDFIRQHWPNENPRDVKIAATGGGAGAHLLAGAWFTEEEVEWTPRCFEGRFYSEVAASVKSRIARV